MTTQLESTFKQVTYCIFMQSAFIECSYHSDTLYDIEIYDLDNRVVSPDPIHPFTSHQLRAIWINCSIHGLENLQSVDYTPSGLFKLFFPNTYVIHSLVAEDFCSFVWIKWVRDTALLLYVKQRCWICFSCGWYKNFQWIETTALKWIIALFRICTEGYLFSNVSEINYEDKRC